MPAVDAAPVPKKSKMWFRSITTSLFRILSFVLLPHPMMALDGRSSGLAGPMSHKEMVLLSLPVRTAPVVAPVLKRMVPPAVFTDVIEDPRILHLVTVLFVASLMNRIVLVLAVAEAVVLDSVNNEFPFGFKPLIVTLSAPFRSINGRPGMIAPEIVHGPPAGDMVTLV